ncbi:MAG: hypothetical protein FJ388_09485 [Verrucomicrobia bacterium]|nr:hypothetical protein [Verrucomicrobiota bacterium]
MSVRSVMEDVLVTMLWAGDQLSRPTLGKLLEPFEVWEHRHGLQRQLGRMEERKLVMREQRGNQIVYQLTSLGRLEALGGKDVRQRWDRPWDGRWRQVLFDLPVTRKRVRIRLWRWLRENGFGYLQQSLWIQPDPVTELTEALRDFRDDVETFILMEATCCAGYSNARVVEGAWDFAEINKRHEAVLATASVTAHSLDQMKKSPERLGAWLRAERMAWEHALAVDPLLPRVLWPKGYRGEQAWLARLDCLSRITERFS